MEFFTSTDIVVNYFICVLKKSSNMEHLFAILKSVSKFSSRCIKRHFCKVIFNIFNWERLWRGIADKIAKYSGYFIRNTTII